jgi:hydroxypyruvate reductase
MTDHRTQLLEMYASGLVAVNGELAVYKALHTKGLHQPCHVIAIGKAADAMLWGAYRYLRDAMQGALLITKHQHVSAATQALPQVQILESAHPIPDESSLQAGAALIQYLQALPADAPVLFLISGGTSSLVEVLDSGWTLNRLQQATQDMLANGAVISEINAMRRTLSLIKGGKLWQYVGERPVTCLLMSDVPGDDPAVIGSGLLFPATSDTFTWEIVASNRQLLAALAATATATMAVNVMPEFLEGDTEVVAQRCIAHLRHSAPGIYVWGAETTLQLPLNPGYGGRNQHFALAAALCLQPEEDIFLMAVGTDGTDGVTADTGALVDSGTVQRGNTQNLDAVACLQTADAGTFLAASGDLIHTGPTGTNVMDVIIGWKVS